MFWPKMLAIIALNSAVDVLTFKWVGAAFGRLACTLVGLVGAGVALSI